MSTLRRPLMASILAVEICIFFNMDLFLSGFPLYVSGLGIREDRMGILFGMFMLSALAFRPVFARIGQFTGQKTVLAVGATAALVVPLLYAAVSSFWALLLVRLLHGLVPATFITASQLLLIREAGEKHKAVALGLFGMMGGLSLLFMPYVGVYLLTNFGTGIWLAAASFSGLSAVSLFLLFVRRRVSDVETTTASPERLDLRLISVPLTCMVLFSLAFGSVMTYVSTYAVSQGFANPGQFFTVLAVTNLAMKVLFIRFGDNLPQRRVMLPAALIFAFGLLLLAWPQNPHWLLWAAVPIGIGLFAITGMMMLNVTNAVPGVTRSMAAAWLANSFDFGLATASMALGFVVTQWSYQVLYSTAAVLALGAFVLMALFFKERPLPA